MRRYTGPDVCAGCGTPGTVKARLSKSDICYDCKKLIDLGKGVRQSSSEFGIVKLSWHTLKRVKLSTSPYVHDKECIKAIPFQKGHLYNSKTSQELYNAFKNLLKHLDRGEKDAYDGGIELYLTMEESGGSSKHLHDTFYLDKQLLEPLYDLLYAMANHERALAEEYYEKGHNLLMGLQTGDVSVKEFNERTK